MAIPDTFDAMTSNRPYRKGLSPEIAIGEIEKQAGIQFDPEFSKAFIKIYSQGKISSILQDYAKDEYALCCPFCSTFMKIPEANKDIHVVECSVCHRKVKIQLQESKWYVELN